MSYLSLPAAWFAIGGSLVAFAVLGFLVSIFVKRRKLRVISSILFFTGLVLVIGALVVGDWSISECYNSEGEFMADGVRCIFP